MQINVPSIAKKLWLDWGRPILYALAIVLPLRSSLADWYEVPTGSMRPSIIEGDRVFVNKLAYDLKVPFTTWHIADWSNPKRGDVVVFNSPKDGVRLVKRVVGIPGDVISMRDDRLLVNGVAVEYDSADPRPFQGFYTVRDPQSKFLIERLPGKSHVVALIPSIQAMRSFGPVTIPAGQYFMMGDNRDNSADSRYIGLVDRQRILGHALAVVLSFDYNRYHLPRLHRFLQEL